MTTDRQFTRRDFIQASGTCALGAGILANTTIASAARKSKNLVACRDAHLRDVKAMDSWDAMKKVGVDGVELWVNDDRTCPYLFPNENNYSIKTPKDIKALDKAFRQSGMKITALCMGNHFDEGPEEELAFVADVVQAAKIMNVDAIRIDVVPRKLEGDAFTEFAISIGKELVEIVQGTDIRYGIENHGSTTNDPEFLDKLFDGVGSDVLGLTLDTANFYWFGHPLNDLYTIYEKYASRACHTHCKSINYPHDKRNIRRERGWEYGKYCCPIDQGDIDFKKVVATLEAVNYKGDYCVENESLGRFPEEQREGILRREAAYLRKLI